MLSLDIVFWIDRALLFYRSQVKLYASETSELSIDHNETILNAMECKRISENPSFFLPDDQEAIKRTVWLYLLELSLRNKACYSLSSAPTSITKQYV